MAFTRFLVGPLFVLSALLYSSFWVIPSILMLPFSVKYSRLLIEQLVMETLFGLVASILEIVSGIKVVVSGNVAKKLSGSRPTLIIMNHRCRFDWFFMWCYMLRRGSFTKERIFLKSGLAKIPFAGWTMDLGMFIFLHRKWLKDQENITNMIDHFCNNSLPVQLLMFPEGTDLSDLNRTKDKEYALKNGLHVNEHVLHPRTTGFVHCVKVLRDWGEFDICDLTVGYVGNIPQTEMHLMKGKLPSQIHFNSNIIPFSEFSSLDDEELGLLLQKIWKEKEDSLKLFYQQNSFGSTTVFKDNWIISLKLWGYLAYALFSFILFFYYLPWTLLAVMFFGIVTYCVFKFKGGWSAVILSWSKRKEH